MSHSMNIQWVSTMDSHMSHAHSAMSDGFLEIPFKKPRASQLWGQRNTPLQATQGALADAKERGIHPSCTDVDLDVPGFEAIVPRVASARSGLEHERSAWGVWPREIGEERVGGHGFFGHK